MNKLLKLGLIAGGAALVAKLVAAKKSKWQGLTEAEVREKFETRLGSRVPDEKRAAIADEVVSKMRQRGVLREDEDGPDAGDGEAADEDTGASDTAADDPAGVDGSADPSKPV